MSLMQNKNWMPVKLMLIIQINMQVAQGGFWINEILDHTLGQKRSLRKLFVMPSKECGK